jgi:hypothetical protein
MNRNKFAIGASLKSYCKRTGLSVGLASGRVERRLYVLPIGLASTAVAARG